MKVLSSTAIAGKSIWRSGDQYLEIDSTDRKFVVKINMKSKEGRVHGEFEATKLASSLAMLYPLEMGDFPRAGYTNKAPGMKVTGTIHCGSEAISLDGGFCTLDWTNSFARRETRWKWVSFASDAVDEEGAAHKIGVNLSAEVYGSAENVVFVDGKLYLQGSIEVDNSNKQEIRIQTTDKSVELTFHPLVTKADNVNFLVIKEKFEQSCGEYSGVIRITAKGEKNLVLNINKSIGIYEDHYALW